MTAEVHTADIIVIGGGIAGVSAAAELAADASVTVLEAESQAGYHATSRSAAYFATAYGNPVIQAVTACCENFLMEPPDGFCEVELLRPRDSMYFGREDQVERLLELQREIPRLEFLDAKTVCERVSVMSPDYVHGAMRDPKGGDLDVDALLQAYLKQFRRRGGRFLADHRVTAITRKSGVWELDVDGRIMQAPVVVNAAGAWVERIAALAGLGSLGIQPLRRTALTVSVPEGVEIRDWPEMMDADEEFYFKPDAGQIMISPADETPTEPCDAQPEEFDVAMGVYRFEQATGLDIRRVNHSWAGLRTFAPDRVLVAGFDPRSEGFFWLAGQGGFGVGTAPAMAKLTRRLIQGSALEADFAGLESYIGALAPDRLIGAGRQD